jgi:hypothetical protein
VATLTEGNVSASVATVLIASITPRHIDALIAAGFIALRTDTENPSEAMLAVRIDAKATVDEIESVV